MGRYGKGGEAMNTPEISMMAILEADLKRRYGDHFVKAEVRTPMGTIDLVYCDSQIWCFSGKMQLDDVVIEQARLVRGKCDASFVTVPKPKRLTPEHEARLGVCSRLGLGVVYMTDKSVKSILMAHRDPTAQVDEMRKWFDQSENAGVLPGSPTGSANTPDAAWYKTLESEFPIPIKLVPKLVGCYPNKSKQQTRNHLHRIIDRGEKRYSVVDGILNWS
jgi:hypothetical protein